LLLLRSDIALGTYSSLTKNQKEATFLLAIGTFLEYFDFMRATRGC
jgi:hypothetical protein